MKKLKQIGSQLPVLLLWAFVAVFFWTWIFTFLTDTRAENKLVLYADVPAIRKTDLALRLEAEAFPGIRMVRVGEFSDVLFDGNPLRAADLYILPASRASDYLDWFVPLPDDFSSADHVLEIEGVALGLPVFLPESRYAVATDYVEYTRPGTPDRPYYLFFGNQSFHLKTNAGATDHLAVDAAKVILQLK